jgi:probable selenium-dependent hydroxylase accessory protein YqeC
MRLCEALDIHPGETVAFVGAGGKTTAIWRVQAELTTAGQRAIVTTTTKIMEPILPPDGVLLWLVDEESATLLEKRDS